MCLTPCFLVSLPIIPQAISYNNNTLLKLHTKFNEAVVCVCALITMGSEEVHYIVLVITMMSTIMH